MAHNDDVDALETYEGEAVGRSVGRGLAALLVVALAVGLLFGGGILMLTKLAGLGGGDAGAASSAQGSATLYMPEPKVTETPKAPATAEQPRPEEKPRIELVASPETVASYGQITLSGRYPQGVGSVLLVERKSGDSWVPFADGNISTVVKQDGSFTTWVKTAQSGPNVFRVTDQDQRLSSPAVTVTVG